MRKDGLRFRNRIAIFPLLYKRHVNLTFDTLYCSFARIFQEKRALEGRKIYCSHSQSGHVIHTAHDPGCGDARKR